MLSVQTEYPTYGISVGDSVKNISLSPVCKKLLRIVALFISRQYVRQCQKYLLRTENLGVHLLCCCPRTNYEHLWTSVFIPICICLYMYRYIYISIVHMLCSPMLEEIKNLSIRSIKYTLILLEARTMTFHV